MCCLLNAESGEAEGTAEKEKRLEEEFLATKARGHSTFAWACWREDGVKGSENDEDEQRATVLVWRKDEKTGFIKW